MPGEVAQKNLASPTLGPLVTENFS
jgi:hypothetical protein